MACFWNSAKKEQELLDLFHGSNMQELEFFAVIFFNHAFLSEFVDIYCMGYIFLCNLCYLSNKLLWNERVV